MRSTGNAMGTRMRQQTKPVELAPNDCALLDFTVWWLNRMAIGYSPH
jgi:hypothetical protein